MTCLRSSAAAPAGPLVSAIVPVYQGEGVIRGAVRSALAQTYRNLEVIVVDDGSADRTLDVLRALDDPRLFVLEQRNGGASAARNLGLRHARGEYVAFLDADDRWLPRKIEIEVELLRRASTPGIAYSWYFAVDDAGRLLQRSRTTAFEGFALDGILRSETFLLPSVSLYDRRIFDAVGPFAARRFHEDFEFNLRAAGRFPIFPTRRYLAVYRQSLQGKGRSVLADFERARREQLSIVEDARALLEAGQTDVLRGALLQSLYCRFLMYGYDDSAKRLEREVDMRALHGPKGKLARLFGATRLNLFPAVRGAIQTCNRLASGRAWERRLSRERLELDYACEPARR